MGWNEVMDVILALPRLVFALYKFIEGLVFMIPKILNIVLLFLDPGKLLNDIIFGATTGIYMLLEALFDIIFGKVRDHMGFTNKRGSNKGTLKNSSCLPPTFVQILILVLCPPLYVVLKEGILNAAGLFPVILTSILTYFYYFPGLIYASLFVFC